jgi:hypothetical protein
MHNEERTRDVQPDISNTSMVEKEDVETSSDARRKRSSRRRTDKARLHAVKHGILARPLLEALVGRGENVRQLREIERVLREELQPVGILGELLFDRAWSSYLRCLLIVRTEARVLTVDGPPSKLPVIPSLPVKEYPFSFDDISFLHLQHLALIQRYDAYFSRDFFRATELLMAMRDGSKAGLTRQLEKPFGKNKDDPNE